MYVCMHVCTYVFMYARMYVCLYVCTYVHATHMYVCIHICTYACARPGYCSSSLSLLLASLSAVVCHTKVRRPAPVLQPLQHRECNRPRPGHEELFFVFSIVPVHFFRISFCLPFMKKQTKNQQKAC